MGTMRQASNLFGEMHMIFKKILSAVTLLALIFAMAACSSSGSEAETGTDPITTTAPVQTTVPATTTQPETTEPAYEQIVLVDDENCTMIIKSVDAGNIMGYTLNVFLENKTDKELMFSVDNVSVNGYMCDPFWASTVSAGKKANRQIQFSESDFAENGIREVSEITLTVNIYDNGNWAADYLVAETMTIHP